MALAASLHGCGPRRGPVGPTPLVSIGKLAADDALLFALLPMRAPLGGSRAVLVARGAVDEPPMQGPTNVAYAYRPDSTGVMVWDSRTEDHDALGFPEVTERAPLKSMAFYRVWRDSTDARAWLKRLAHELRVDIAGSACFTDFTGVLVQNGEMNGRVWSSALGNSAKGAPRGRLIAAFAFTPKIPVDSFKPPTTAGECLLR